MIQIVLAWKLKENSTEQTDKQVSSQRHLSFFMIVGSEYSFMADEMAS